MMVSCTVPETICFISLRVLFIDILMRILLNQFLIYLPRFSIFYSLQDLLDGKYNYVYFSNKIHNFLFDHFFTEILKRYVRFASYSDIECRNLIIFQCELYFSSFLLKSLIFALEEVSSAYEDEIVEHFKFQLSRFSKIVLLY